MNINGKTCGSGNRYVRSALVAFRLLAFALIVAAPSFLELKKGPLNSLGPMYAQTNAPYVSEPGKDQTWKGNYVNYQHGFSVVIPKGLIGLGPAPPTPQHGIKIIISEPAAHIFVDAYKSAIDYPSLTAAVDSDLEETRKNARGLEVIDRHREQLGPLEAIRVKFRRKDATSEVMFIEEKVTAIRNSRHPEDGILYTVALVTSEPRYESDRRLFEAVLRTWHLRPLPK
jgi:hypothetical protein